MLGGGISPDFCLRDAMAERLNFCIFEPVRCGGGKAKFRRFIFAARAPQKYKIESPAGYAADEEKSLRALR